MHGGAPGSWAPRGNNTRTAAQHRQPPTRRRTSPWLELKANTHMLLQACGYALANKRHDTRAIQRWLDIDRCEHAGLCGLGTTRFKDFWRD
jgi:hypothetical protein